MKYILVYISFLVFICLSVSGQVDTVSDNGKYNIKKIDRIQSGLSYSDLIFTSPTKNETVPGFAIYNSYLIKPGKCLAYGFGTGFQLYKKQIFIPAYFNVISCFQKNLLLDIQTGFSFGWKRKSTYYENYTLGGGFFNNIGAGYKFKISNEFSSCFEISYNFQHASLNSEILPTDKIHIHSVMFTFGLILE